jgi:hypothetical protein
MLGDQRHVCRLRDRFQSAYDGQQGQPFIGRIRFFVPSVFGDLSIVTPQHEVPVAGRAGIA